MKYVIPVLILLVLVVALVKKINVYEAFIYGTTEALKLCYKIFPYIAAVYIAVYLFRKSGLSAGLTSLLTPVMTFLKIPPELTELIIVKPISGNGSMALLQDIIETYGPDSYITRVASVIMGSSETVFYISAIYLSTVKVKKTGGAIAISLISTFFGVIAACLLCRVM